MPKLKRQLKIVEAIPKKGNPGQEKPILEEFLKMVDMRYESLAVDNRKTEENLKQDFLHKLFFGEKKTRYRYIHISAHGDVDGDSLIIGPKQEDPKQNCVVTSDDVRSHWIDRCKRPLKGSLITLSACGNLVGGFAEALQERGANSVIRPLNEVNFSESAMFVILFYFMLGRHHGLDECKKTPRRIAEYVDIFQRTKMSYLNIGGTGTFRLDYWIRQGKKIEHGHLF